MTPEESELPPGVRNLYQRKVDDRDVEVYITDDATTSSVDLLDRANRAAPGSTLLLDEAGAATRERRRKSAVDFGELRRETKTTLGTSQKPDRDSAAKAEEEARKRSVGPRSSTTSGGRDGGPSSSLGSGTSDDPLGLSRSVSNRDLEKKLHAYGRKIDDLEDAVERVEAKLDAVVSLLGGATERETIVAAATGEITHTAAAEILDVSTATVSKRVQELHNDLTDADVDVSHE